MVLASISARVAFVLLAYNSHHHQPSWQSSKTCSRRPVPNRNSRARGNEIMIHDDTYARAAYRLGWSVPKEQPRPLRPGPPVVIVAGCDYWDGNAAQEDRQVKGGCLIRWDAPHPLLGCRDHHPTLPIAAAQLGLARLFVAGQASPRNEGDPRWSARWYHKDGNRTSTYQALSERLADPT